MFLFIGVFCAHVSVITSMHIWEFGHVFLELQIIFLGKMKKMKCKPVHWAVSCLKFADYRFTDSCLLNIVSVHAMRVSGEQRYISTHS
jgi:hypothetical protein